MSVARELRERKACPYDRTMSAGPERHIYAKSCRGIAIDIDHQGNTTCCWSLATSCSNGDAFSLARILGAQLLTSLRSVSCNVYRH